ncbi:hypothetical protein H9P43_002435 [Blastocladiella emersonii ATCC 22665]|nr:hypothetical protein H9P43_002435 [Blastocladiella emersonii ATCC 22665]
MTLNKVIADFGDPKLPHRFPAQYPYMVLSQARRTKDILIIWFNIHFGNDKNQLAQGDNKTKSVPACAVTAAAVLNALAGVHVLTLRAAFEPAAVTAVTPAAVPTTQAAATALIKTKETSTCPDSAGTVSTEFSTTFGLTAATHAPTAPAKAEKKRSTAGKVLR